MSLSFICDPQIYRVNSTCADQIVETKDSYKFIWNDKIKTLSVLHRGFLFGMRHAIRCAEYSIEDQSAI